MSASNPTTVGKRLDSWKEIAAFFGRDERTVNRWEKELGLPVHRLPGTKGRVYAFSEELAAWLAAPNNAGAAEDGALTVVAGGRTLVAGLPGNPPDEKIRARLSGRYGNGVSLLAAAILGAAAIALVLFHPSGNRRPGAVVRSGSRALQSPRGTVVLASTPTHDPEAEQLYLKGRYYWNKRTPEDLNKALDYFMQAVVHDPNYSQAYAGLADCYNLMREYTLMPSAEAYSRALAAAKKAVELDNQSSEAHAALAFVSFFGMWDLATGDREFRRAIDLDPNNPKCHHWYANALLVERRLPEAIAEIDRAQVLDPASAAILADKGNILLRASRSAEAVSLLQTMEIREPNFRSPHLYLKYAYLSNHDYPSYLSELRKDALVMHDDSALAIAVSAEKHFAAGGPRSMFEGMLQIQKKLWAQHSIPPADLAETFALLGNKTDALRYLWIAYEQRDGSLLFIETYPEFNCLHDQPAYHDLLARMNLPPQA